MRDCLHHTVANDKLLSLAPSGRRPDLVVRCRGELRSAVLARLRDRELEEVIRRSVVEPVDDPLRDDLSALRIVREDLDRHPLVDDLPDLLLGTVRERHASPIGKAAEHHTYLFAQLVDEQRGGVEAVERAGELAHGLRHQPRLQADVRVAHLAVDLGARDERGDRVDHDEVERPGVHEHVRDLERLLAGVRLRHEQLVDVHAERARVRRVERVLRVDERRDAALRLRLRDDVQGHRGLARALGPIDFDDPPARHPADAERHVQRQRPRGDDGGAGPHRVLPQAHDRALAVLLLDLLERDLQHLVSFHFSDLPIPMVGRDPSAGV